MKFKFKKFVYLINDFTDLLLKKEKEDLTERNKVLTAWVLFLVIFLILSVTLNIYLYYQYV